ncbi:MAG TPA: hypothetical protein PKA05_16060 [Roseiflexaceae bacterium]|nr:hypothetical protein [Roseiflexaceae bacterium]
MHTQARVMIKTALMQLLASMLLGALILANSELQFSHRLILWLPVYYHLLMVGWVTQLIAGVALWMFPVISREQPRVDERIGWVAYGALNGGLLLRAIAEPQHAAEPQRWSAWLLLVTGVLQIVAVWALVIAIWPRVRQRTAARSSGGA